MKLYLRQHRTRGPQQKTSSATGLHRQASCCDPQVLCTVHPQSQSNNRQVLLSASTNWDVIIVEKRHNLKSEDYSFKKLQSDKLTLWN